MTNVTEKAQKACSLTWKEGGNVTVLWVDTNERTGEVRVYQRVLSPGNYYSRVRRFTGKNLTKLMTEIDKAEGEFEWTYVNSGAMSLIRSWLEHIAPRCLCGAGRVGEERNGFRHGKHHCVAIGTQEACRWPRPNERRIADRSDVFDPEPQ